MRSTEGESQKDTKHMIIRTESGSLYEIDVPGSRIRRLRGTAPGTARVGNDGDWRAYSQLFPAHPERGSCLSIIWAADDRGPAARPGHVPGTMTSPVVEVYP